MLKKSFIHISYFVAIIWICFFVSMVLPIKEFGLIPRTSIGLIGIITSPFLHGNLAHIISNTIALITFAPILALISDKEGVLEKLVILTIVTGVLTWLFARTANHIGASGLIFALYGYLISLGLFKKKFLQIALSLFMIISYGYMFFGILPIRPGVSWDGHLFGLIAGILVAKVSSKSEKASLTSKGEISQ